MSVFPGARELSPAHLSIRVPWHDTDWTGRVCHSPRSNTSCLFLKRIGQSRNDEAEEAIAGSSFEHLAPAQLPPCVDENVSFLAPYEITRQKTHPYSEFSELHKHFAPTLLRQPPYSAACIPFRWMLREQAFGDSRSDVAGFCQEYQLGGTPEREPNLGAKLSDVSWVQERENQLVLLDTFFSVVRPQSSLCFFYAKKTPLSDDPRRVIVAVARCTAIGEPVEYRYTTDDPPLRGMLWERMVSHSLRPDQSDGFVLPYQALLERAESDPSIIPGDYAAYAPESSWDAYSYATEHVSDDQAIESLLACAGVLERMASVVDVDLGRASAWIDTELNRLWKLRGAYPGFGSALRALGIQNGTLIAHAISHLAGMDEQGIAGDPWEWFDRVVAEPSLLPGELARTLGKGYRRVWETMTQERKALLKLISRFGLSAKQATRYFQPSERRAAGVDVDDAALLRNPYLLYELDRPRIDSIPVTVIDRGAFPELAIAARHPLPDPSALEDAVDPRRVRALIVDTLERAAGAGHTLLPEDHVLESVRAQELRPPCPLGPDVLRAATPTFRGVIEAQALGDGRSALQLDERSRCSELIRREVNKRAQGRRHVGDHPWRSLVNGALGAVPICSSEEAETEERARQEKGAAIEELFRARVSLLLGPAGSGKTTLLRVLCRLPEVERGGVLLLAPTGKARVRLEIGTGLTGGLTIAQLLSRLGRYDGQTGRYRVTGSAQKEGGYKTVIVDEASMLTEDQLGALIDALSGVERLILVGDTRQLPPIGAGRPLVDIAARLAPESLSRAFPRVASSIAELTITRRQGGNDREDTLFARSFADDGSDAATDEAWRRVLAGESENVRILSWNSPEQLRELLLETMAAELKFNGVDDEQEFARSLGGTAQNGWTYFNAAYQGRPGAAELAESWQVLAPVRAHDYGVDALNRLIQRQFRSKTIQSSQPERDWTRMVPRPQGPQQLVYGDKVINVRNEWHEDVFPRNGSVFIANGDIGIIVGQFRTPKFQGPPWKIEVEFTSRAGIKCGFGGGYFGEESSPPLELAYALTIHKTQGSEFGTTFVIVPNPCWLLSRELLYTALTRHRNRLVLFCQGDPHELRKYGSPAYSEVAARLTNLFTPANPVTVPVGNKTRFLEQHLIHRTERGDLVRSKSEVIIADKLHARGINYGYEQPVRLADGVERFPDFTIVDDASGVTYYWEHLGLVADAGYRRRWEQKLKAYRASGILPDKHGGGENGTLILTEDQENGAIDSANIAALIDRIAG